MTHIVNVENGEKQTNFKLAFSSVSSLRPCFSCARPAGSTFEEIMAVQRFGAFDGGSSKAKDILNIC